MRLNVLLAAALILSAAANIFVRPVSSRPNVEFMPEMVRTASYKAYSPNPNFPDGITLQMPPPNTLPRGFTPVRYQAGETEALRAGQELTNPFQPEDLAAYSRGGEVFRTWCQPCHGASGRGDGPVAMRGFPAPPPMNSQKSLAMKDGQMFHVATFGQKNMPSYAAQVSADDRWKAVLYVRSLQRSLQPQALAIGATVNPDPKPKP